MCYHISILRIGSNTWGRKAAALAEENLRQTVGSGTANSIGLVGLKLRPGIVGTIMRAWLRLDRWQNAVVVILHSRLRYRTVIGAKDARINARLKTSELHVCASEKPVRRTNAQSVATHLQLTAQMLKLALTHVSGYFISNMSKSLNMLIEVLVSNVGKKLLGVLSDAEPVQVKVVPQVCGEKTVRTGRVAGQEVKATSTSWWPQKPERASLPARA